MKKTIYILTFILFFFAGFIPAKGEETPPTITPEKEYREVDAIQYDTITYQKFKKDRFYNYYQANVEKNTFTKRLTDAFYRWLINHIDSTISQKSFNIILWVLGIIFIIVVLIIMYFIKPSIFYINKKTRLAYLLEDEDINGLDFDQLIEKALSEKGYSDAIRWAYLKTLKVLHENKLISYDTFKTVNEYVYEIKAVELKKQFRKLSLEFVYYRYGNGEADENKFLSFQSLSKQVIDRCR